MKKLITLIVMISFVLASCGGTSSTDKDTLNVEIPLKTKSIAPYETDIPVKT
ncbi:ABC transporter substrate-binding protein, partial [Paraburkholderia tropica]